MTGSSSGDRPAEEMCECGHPKDVHYIGVEEEADDCRRCFCWSFRPATPPALRTAEETCQCRASAVGLHRLGCPIRDKAQRESVYRALASVPTNAELAERAKSLDAHTVVRNWLSRHQPPTDIAQNPTLLGQWLDWAASNFLADPEVGVHLVTAPPAVRTGDDVATVELRDQIARALAGGSISEWWPAVSDAVRSHWLAEADRLIADVPMLATLSTLPPVSGMATRDDVARVVTKHWPDVETGELDRLISDLLALGGSQPAQPAEEQRPDDVLAEQRDNGLRQGARRLAWFTDDELRAELDRRALDGDGGDRG